MKDNKNLPPVEETVALPDEAAVENDIPDDTPAVIEPLADGEGDADEPHRDAPAAQGLSDIEAFACADTREVKKTSKRRHSRVTTLLATFAAAAILVGCAFGVVFLFPPEEETVTPTEPDTSVAVLDKSVNADGTNVEYPIKSIQVDSLLNDYTLKLNEFNTWVLNDEDDLPLNTSVIDDLVSSFKSVTAQDTVLSPNTTATADVSMKDFGFDNPTVTATVTYFDDSVVVFRLASLAVGNNYYLCLDDTDTVYLVDSTLADAAMTPLESYVTLEVITPPSVNSEDANGTVIMKELSLTGTVRDNVITTVRPKDPDDGPQFENTSYVLTAPYLSATNSDVTTDLFASTSLTASEAVVLHPTAEQLAEYGLAEPRSVAHIQLAVLTTATDETTGEITESGYYNVRNHIVKLGKKTSDGASYYAMVDTLDVIYLIDASAVLWAEKTYHDITNPYLFLRNLSSLSAITCTVDGVDHTFRFAHHPDGETLDDELTVTLNGETLRTHEFRVLFQVLMTLYRTGAAPAEPQGDPLLTVRIHSTDETVADAVIDIYEYSGSVCIARTETGDTYKMTASRVLDAIDQIHNYINGDDVINRF